MAASERLRFPVGFNRFTVGYLLEHDVAPLSLSDDNGCRPEATSTRPLAPSCATCWAAGVIWDPLEGIAGALLPMACPACGGSGQSQ